MKKLIRVLCATFVVAMLCCCLYVPASAATVDWSTVQLQPLVSMINGYIEESDELLLVGQNSMRGFAMSPDGRFAFCGYLNPNSAAGVNVIDLETALAVDSWQHVQADGGLSYPKGLAVDDRGYLYVGAAYYPNYGVVDYAIVAYNDKGELSEVGFYNAVTEGTAGDKSGTKMGVNGVDVAKIGDKYYLYMIINYDLHRLYRIDVTDVKAPALDTTFGTNGYVDLTAVHTMSDAYYLDVESDGTIYLGAKGSEGKGLFILSADGNTILNYAACTNAYAAAATDDYILVTASSKPCVYVLDKVTLQTVATIDGGSDVNSFVYVTVIDDVMYVADQGADAGYNRIMVAPLNSAGKAIIDGRLAAYAASIETTTAEDTTTAAPTTTPVETTTAEPVTTPEETTTPAPTTTPTPVTTTTASTDDDNGGCGSVVALGLMACMIPAAVVICRKKRD